MPYNAELLVWEALDLKATHAAIAKVDNIVFSESLRSLCAQNVCGKYGTNWMCPPGVGELPELKGRVKKYKQGLLIQTVYQLEDSFDFEGMMTAKNVHDTVFRNIYSHLKETSGFTSYLPLNAGACELCPECSYVNNQQCRMPDKAISSVEAYGIDVGALVAGCGIPYNNGKDTVSYVGLILFDANPA